MKVQEPETLLVQDAENWLHHLATIASGGIIPPQTQPFRTRRKGSLEHRTDKGAVFKMSLPVES